MEAPKKQNLKIFFKFLTSRARWSKMKTIFKLKEGAPVYKTRQRQAILDYLTCEREGHLTAKQIAAHFAQSGAPIGLTTIYRRLEELERLGKVRRYHADGDGACFQLIDENGGCCEHFHLKCEVCGRLLHMECDYLEGIAHHIEEEHGFLVNPSKLLLYGVCEECREKVEKE